MAKPAQIPALTSIRGIAAWWVVVYHFRDQLAPHVPEAVAVVAARGFLAVDLFFVLSGFVIALNYGAAFDRLSWSEVRRFLVARLARIYPLHLTMCLLFLANPLAIHLFASSGAIGERYDAGAWLMNLALVQSWGFIDHMTWNVPAWSISTEWFAYLLFPAAAFALSRAVRSPAAALALAAACLVALPLALSAAGVASLGAAITSYGLVRCVLQFLVGAALSRAFVLGLRAGAKAHAALLAAAAGLGALHLILGVGDHWVLPAAFACLVFALTSDGAALNRALALPALVWIGEISYSTYLVHYFVKDWTKFLLVAPGTPSLLPFIVYIAVTFAASVLLYRTIEVPGRRLVRRLGDRRPRLAGGEAVARPRQEVSR